MKRLVLSGLLMAASIVAAADGISLSTGRALLGQVAVGPNLGAACSVGISTIRQDIYSPRYEAVIRIAKKENQKWVVVRGESFSMRNYNNGELFGAKQLVAQNGARKKITASLFFDQLSHSYKVILIEANLNSDGSGSKYIVCENMKPF